MFLTSSSVQFWGGVRGGADPVARIPYACQVLPYHLPLSLGKKAARAEAVLFSLFFCWQDIAAILHHRHFQTRRHVHVHPSRFISSYRSPHPLPLLPPHVQIFLRSPTELLWFCRTPRGELPDAFEYRAQHWRQRFFLIDKSSSVFRK